MQRRVAFCICPSLFYLFSNDAGLIKPKNIWEDNPILKEHRINQRIRVPEVRLIGADGSQLGIMDSRDAIRLAEDQGLDLVEIAPDAKPPVCKIMDYGKFVYAEEKKLKESRKKQHQTKVKEIRLGPQMGEHDYQVKFNQAKEFLAKRDKVKVSMRFRGREMAHVDIGQRLIDRFIADIAPFASVESAPKMEGRTINLMVSPK